MFVLLLLAALVGCEKELPAPKENTAIVVKNTASQRSETVPQQQKPSDDTEPNPVSKLTGLTGNYWFEFTSKRDQKTHRSHLCLQENTDGTIDASAFFAGSGGHSCGWSDTVQRIKKRTRPTQYRALKPKDCNVDISVYPNRVELKPIGDSCDESCGVRASIGGTFSRNTRSDYDANACKQSSR